MARPSQVHYDGPTRKLVLAFDVGTTFSGISYCILNPGEIPTIAGVNRYPAQENVGGDSKIPTIIYYDPSGQPRAFGAEALTPVIMEQAEEEGWKKVEWFKLHLRPRSMGASIDGTQIPKIPFGKTVTDVFADFLGYLFRCAKKYIIESSEIGTLVWKSVEDSIHFVLTHPNGWSGPQQTRMRRAAIMAGLVPDTPEGRMRVRFVTEGEASLHFCLNKGIAVDTPQIGKKVIIADAGGGTIDVTSYTFTSLSPLTVEESAVPACKAQGSVFVSRRAHAFLKNRLCSSKYGSPEDIDLIADIFDKTAKRIFKSQTEPSYIKFGRPTDKDIQFGIRSGQVKLDGATVASFFEPAIASLVEAVEAQVDPVAENGRTPVFLVGGFAASPWLFTELESRLQLSGASVCRPDSHTNKAVADGALFFSMDDLVAQRMAKTTLGAFGNVVLKLRKQGHQKRLSSVYTDIAGTSRVPDHFTAILQKGTKVSTTEVYRGSYIDQSTDLATFRSLSVSIHSYTGDGAAPVWQDQDPDKFVKYCEVTANLSALVNDTSPLIGRGGALYYRVHYCVAIQFGETETRAFIEWEEDGIQKRGPATVTYDDDFVDVPDEEEEEAIPSDVKKELDDENILKLSELQLGEQATNEHIDDWEEVA